VLYSGKSSDADALTHLRQYLDSAEGKPLLLLVSGKVPGQPPSAAGADSEILCGVYLAGAVAAARQMDFGAIFQLRPLHRALCATGTGGSVHLLPQEDGTSPGLFFQSSSPGRETGFLSLSGPESGELVFPSALSVVFRVKTVDLFEVEPVFIPVPPRRTFKVDMEKRAPLP
jgi:hypothetical protein